MSRHSASCSLRALRVPCEHPGSPCEPLEYLEYTVSTTWLRPPQESARGVRVRAARKHGTKIVLPSFVAASIQARAPHEYSSTRRCVEWEAWDQRTATAVRCGPSNERARVCARACGCARARVGTCMHTTARAGVRACVCVRTAYSRGTHRSHSAHGVLTAYPHRTHGVLTVLKVLTLRRRAPLWTVLRTERKSRTSSHRCSPMGTKGVLTVIKGSHGYRGTHVVLTGTGALNVNQG